MTNILFLFSDQQRADTCGCYGQPLPVTPNLDRMARDGVLFRNAFTCQPVCGPARAALQTGRWPTELGCETNNRRLPPDADTLAKRLASAGWWTGYLGKWHLASCKEERHEGFVPAPLRGGYRDFWLASDILEFTSHGHDGRMFAADGTPREFPAGRFRADVQTDWLLEALGQVPRDRPFFLFSSWIEPHHQNDHNRYEGPVGSAERFKDFLPPGDLWGKGGDWRENYPDYLGCCHALDQGLGRIRGRLAELGLADDTLIVYTADHGSHFRTRNNEYKRCAHDAAIRIPLVIAGPGFDGGRVVDEVVSLMDLPATLLAAAGVEAPPAMRGRALQPLARGHHDAWVDEAFVQISESQTGRALRTPRWTYAITAPGQTGQAGRSERYVECHLYDNATDPHQQHDLVADPAYAGIRRDLRRRLLAQMLAAGETAPEILPAP